jgi:hypothetical protein
MKSKTNDQASRDRGAPPGAPRWVKVGVVIFIALALLFAAVHLTGHGLGGHG